MPSRAMLLQDRKFRLTNGLIVQIKVWRLSTPTEERPHGLKYSLVFSREGERIVGYDNEAGKGDHRHYREREEPCSFRSMQQLLVDFFDDVKKEIANE